MTPEIIRIEPHVSYRDLSLMWVDGGVKLLELVALEHVEEGALACIVETKEDNVGILLEESEPLESRLEKVNYEHFLTLILL